MTCRHTPADAHASSAIDATLPFVGASQQATFFDAFGEGLAIYSPDGELLHHTDALTRNFDADPAASSRCWGTVRAFARTVARQFADGVRDRSRDAVMRPTANPARVPTYAFSTVTASYRLRGWSLPVGLVRQQSAIVITVERGPAPPPTVEQLQRRFALTRSEARVALLLTERKTNDQIADTLRISPHTARHHTESAFRKLRVHRRTDVARRVAAAAATPEPIVHA